MDCAQNVTYVVFTIGVSQFAVPASEVTEIFRRPSTDIVRLPAAQAFTLGSLNHRGQVTVVFDGRTILGERSFPDELAAVRALLSAREQDHIAWLEALRSSIETHTPFTKTTDPTLCAFGKWFEGMKRDSAALNKFARGNPKLLRLLFSLDAPHRVIHSIAHTAVAHSQAGRNNDAFRVIEDAWDNELAMMKTIFAEIMSELEQVLIISGNAHQERLAIAVDQVTSVGTLQFKLDGAELADRHPMISTMATDKAGRLVQISSFPRLLALCQSGPPGEGSASVETEPQELARPGLTLALAS
ncbi:MAG TPA: chemotaxis protein CheW [Tepidisphaeraceae bacterium]|nr:chemotaxis protein CheW [Tepidisphaeraceae bacterium]